MTPANQHRLSILLLACSLGQHLYSGESSDNNIQFNRDIRPILSDNCYLCHGPDKSTREADLRLDLEIGLSAKLGPDRQVVLPGEPEESELYKRISSTEVDEMMPPPRSHKDLSPEEIKLLKDWILGGAQWEDHWSLAKIERPEPPVADSGWVSNPIDPFILRRLEKENLTPSNEADRRTLIRRASFDLRGLPPTEEETEAFVADADVGAYERLLDQLMASTEYGEHRARYWLDAARYSDTHGFHLDNYRSIWPYRDWVVQAFNENMPFDQFTVEQIAGDLLPEPSQEQLIATGFNRCNPTTSEGGAIDEEYDSIYAKDRVETTSTVWLGMTAGCAACHDHKFDPISQKEFYELTAFFRNTTQKAMDQNIWDTPPSIKVYTTGEQARADELKQLILDKEEAISKLTGDKAEMRPDLSRVASDVLDAHLDPANATGDHGDLGKDQPFTISFWISIPEGAPDNNRELFGRYDADNGNHGWRIRLLKDRIVELALTDDAEEQQTISVKMKDGLKEGTWSHVVISYNGVNRYDSIQAYLRSFKSVVNGEETALKGLSHRSRLYGSIRNGESFSVGPKNAKAAKKDAEKPAIELGQISIFKDVLSLHELKLLASSRFSEENESAAEILDLMREYRMLERELEILEANAPITLVMKEKEDSEPAAHILDRGQYDLLGERVTPNVPKALPPLPADRKPDRLVLANWLINPDNPLTARVTVNRFWQELFGTGIVKTSEDFGSQGERPSHPELLDWLAAEFIESDWDIKHMYKLMMLSSTYRQSSNLTPELLKKDPGNRLLARGPRYRLDAEVIRDQTLFLSESLVGKVGGPPVKPYQPYGVWHAVAYTGSNTAIFEPDNGEKLYRRSLYTFWKRTAPPPSMSIFDAPSRESCSVRRERTNTPLQALVLMNDPQFVEAARRLAEVVLKDPREDKFTTLLSITLGKTETGKAVGILRQTYEQLLGYYRENPDFAKALVQIGESTPDPSLDSAMLAAWTMLASQVMNLDEFVTKS